jgi:Arc/MetJ-type ribon-helix-helix transcriptional regulator
MATTARFARQKISTTISPQTLEFLEGLVKRGEAHTLAEALDLAIGKLQVYENRDRLARDTDAYYANMTGAEAAEERRLEAVLSQASEGIDFEQ